MRIIFMTGALFALAMAGCAVPADPMETSDNEEIGASEATLTLSGADAVPVYFGTENRFATTPEALFVYGRFTAFKGKELDVSLSLAGEGSVGFKLYRELPNGKLKLVDVVDGPSGEASLSFTSKGTGIYVVQLATSASLSDLVLNLGCKGGECSPDKQPGAFCGGLAGIACAEGLYCKYELNAICGAADAGGTCTIRNQACTKEYNPVCGCDGQTYGNACNAAAQGVSVASPGECGAGQGGGGAAEGELCGGIAGIACKKGLYCSYAPEASCGEFDQSGVCAWKPGGCAQIYDPVCGCDGQTYGNACNAASAGVSVAHDGECVTVAQAGESCGGFTMGPPPVCADGLYCSYAMEDSCGWADAPGTCAEKPEVCTKEYNPVCGCDGQTYGNACQAAASGTSVIVEGECQTP